MNRSISQAARSCAVAIATCLLVLGAAGAASADPKGGKDNPGHHDGSGAAAQTSSGTGKAATPQSSAADHSRGNAGTSGNASSPQPLSKADHRSGGANGKCPGGPYCSTRDGSPSLNGNGGGKAVGKPCAGCVGKADNKNPRGQYPNGSDHNAGYECDRNHGVGRSNPAHTGCTGSTTTPPPGGCVENPATPEQDCGSTPPGGCVENPATPEQDCGSTPPGGCVENPATPEQDCGSTPPGGCVENPATPEQDCGSTPPSSGCCTVVSPPSAGAPPAGATLAPSVGRPGRSQAGVLPATGAPANAAALLLASGLLLAGGALLLRRSRATC